MFVFLRRTIKEMNFLDLQLFASKGRSIISATDVIDIWKYDRQLCILLSHVMMDYANAIHYVEQGNTEIKNVYK